MIGWTKRILYIFIFLQFMAVCYDANAVNSANNASLILNSSGEILYERNAQKRLYPASLTKLMTIYLAFEAIKAEQISFNTTLVTSKKASLIPATKLGMRQGETITVRDAILGLIIRSFNDVSVVLAEGIYDSEEKFVRIMNVRARQLGMNETHFKNASGWHHSEQFTTAYDMAKLTIALMRDFPEHYHLFSKNSFVHKGYLYNNDNYVRNHLSGVEGMKTGYTSKAGWNIITTARRGAVRLVGIILGGDTYLNRDLAMMRLMNKYFAVIHKMKEIRKGRA